MDDLNAVLIIIISQAYNKQSNLKPQSLGYSENTLHTIHNETMMGEDKKKVEINKTLPRRRERKTWNDRNTEGNSGDINY